MPSNPTPAEASPIGEPAQPSEELARERAEVLRLRDLLVTRDAELGAARGRLLELETRARYLLGAIRRLRAISRRLRLEVRRQAPQVAGLTRGGAALLDRHAGLRNAGRRAAVDAAVGPPPALSRLGAVPGRRRLEPSLTSPRSSKRPAPATRGSGSSAATPTAASSPPPTTPSRWPAASSSSCSTTTTSSTPTR